MTWPDTVQVVTPTVIARRDTREATLAQWRALGADPVVVEQDPAIPYGHAGCTATASAAVRAGLARHPGWVLYAEDDIDPRLTGWLPGLLGDTPVSLWHRPRFVPAALRHLARGHLGVAPAVGQARWFSSLALLLPARVAQLLVDTPPAPGRGWDLHLRDVLRQHRFTLRVTMPALVEHRPLPRIACPTGPRIESGSYRGPRSA